MRKAFICIFLIFLAMPALAQTSDLDELPLPVIRQRMINSKEDTTKVKLQLAMGHLMFYKATKGNKDIDTAKTLAAEASSLSQKLNYQFGIINAMLLNVEVLYERKDKENGLKIAQNALAYAKKHHNSDGEARSYYQIAKYYPVSDPASLQNRIFYIDRAIVIFRKTHNNLWLSYLLTANADLLFNAERTTEGLRLLFEALNLGKGVSHRTVEGIYWYIGRISFRSGDYVNALKYHLLALKTAREVNDTTMQVGIINHLIASTYIKMQDYRRAIPHSVASLNMAKRYNELEYINTESLALALEYAHTGQLPKALVLLNELKSRAYSDLEKLSVDVHFLNNLTYAKSFTQAAQYAQEITELLTGIAPHNVTELMDAYNSLADYYLETHQQNQAYHYAKLYAAMAHKLNYISGIRTAEHRFYKLITSKGNLKAAIGHFLKEQEMKDSIENLSKTYQLSLLQVENETLEKNRHIDSLKRDALVKDGHLKRNQLLQKVTIGGTLLLLIITVLIYGGYRLKKRSNALLLRQKTEIDQKNVSLQHLLADKNQLIFEKDLLLKEVNHRVKNNLQIVMSLLVSQSGFMPNDKAQKAILEGQNRVQAIALIHEQLYQTGHTTAIDLSLYVKELVRSLDKSLNDRYNNITITCDVDEVTLDVSQAIPVGIILNEAVTNALKYAFPGDKKGTVSIVIKRTDTQIHMKIRDDGVGFPVDFDPARGNSLGITLLEGLSAQLEGTFAIQSDRGLSICLEFPVKFSELPKTS